MKRFFSVLIMVFIGLIIITIPTTFAYGDVDISENITTSSNISASYIFATEGFTVGGYSPFGIFGAEGWVISSDCPIPLKNFGGFLGWLGWNVAVCDGISDEEE
ncbi:MAG: hypothetical protein PHU23_17725, partial [Dehalococcoidales bacterium]|nr:hypothetical protein [Dehalococcoidales bacterium]